MNARSLLLSSLVAFAPAATHAVVDLGGASGISDLYELEFNNGNLFPEGLDPTLDHDGDGIPTLAEYRCFWPNPFDASDSGPKVVLSRIASFAWQVSLPTRKGLRYQVQMSPDLHIWTSVNGL